MNNPEPLISIPRLPWEQVSSRVDELWKPKDSPHHSIIGLTGSGKSYFVAHGLLPLVPYDRVVIIDVKGDDPTLAGIGKPVKELPNRARRTFREMWSGDKERKPGDQWYRLLVSDNWEKGRAQVRKTLERVYNEGNWIVVIDETRYLTDPRLPSLGLRSYVEQLWLRGRSREVCVIAMTQSPKWVPSSFYDQPSFVWIGRINDEDAQKRLTEIGGLNKKEHLPVVRGLKRREWLLIAEGGDELAITGLISGKHTGVKGENDRRPHAPNK